jgi:DNA polymerase-4/DNA polymerase V
MKEAIIHIDGDGFFASCEISLNPSLRGRPVVTGQERGIATAMSREAKAMGISRGMPVFQIKKLFPEATIVHSNHHTYGIFAQRMYNIVRRYTDEVEEYSIDECFAYIDKDPVETARKIKKDLARELGMTFSVGVGPTKVIAKVASKWNKPDGFTVIEKEDIPKFLEDMLVSKVWGIGPSMSQHLYSQGIKTALDLINRPLDWINSTQHKHVRELWFELRGERVYSVHSEPDDAQASIQKTRTFVPSTDKTLIFSELSKNVEGACQRARAYGLVPKRIYYFLKTQEFRYHRFEIPLTVPTASPHIILNEIEKTFDAVYKPHVLYRSTGVTLSALEPSNATQDDLFGETKHNEKWETVYDVVDKIDRKFGTNTMKLASSAKALGKRGHKPIRRLYIPTMGDVV